MKIVEVVRRTPWLEEQLIVVWEKSVKATHLFLSETEVEEIKKYIPQALQGDSPFDYCREREQPPCCLYGD